MSVSTYRAAGLSAALLLGACAGRGDLDTSDGVGVTAVRSSCPTVAVPAGTGDVTLFDPPANRDASALDVTAVLTDVRSTCGDAGDQIVTTVTFDVIARRTNPAAARDVDLPYFIAIVRGGSAVVAKRVGTVRVHFDAGAARAQAAGSASTQVTRAAATLPDDIRQQLTRRRRAGEQDAATDPLSQPQVRQAVLRASFRGAGGVPADGRAASVQRYEVGSGQQAAGSRQHPRGPCRQLSRPHRLAARTRPCGEGVYPDPVLSSRRAVWTYVPDASCGSVDSS